MAKAPRSLAGKVVAITGGARGIGRATAAALIVQGARVAIGDIDAPLAEQTAQELGGGTIGLPLDVTDRASFETFLEEVERQLGPARRADQQRRDHADRPVRGGDRRDRRADDRHQPPRRDLRLQARARALPAPRPRPPGQHRLGGRQGRLPRRGHLLRHQARRGRPERGDPRRGPVHRHRRQHRDAGGGQHRAGLGAAEEPGRQGGRARGRRQRDRRGARRPDASTCTCPRSVKGLFRFMYLVPRSVADFISKVLKGDQVLVNPDHMRAQRLRAAHRRSRPPRRRRIEAADAATRSEPEPAAEPEPAIRQ